MTNLEKSVEMAYDRYRTACKKLEQNLRKRFIDDLEFTVEYFDADGVCICFEDESDNPVVVPVSALPNGKLSLNVVLNHSI